MNYQDARKEWVKDLRSGQYEQGFAALKYNDKYCCLGVACETYRKFNNDLDIGIDSYDRQTCSLPTKVAKWLNIDEYGSCDRIINYSSLMGMNDSGKFPFSLIADVIEQGLVKDRE